MIYITIQRDELEAISPYLPLPRMVPQELTNGFNSSYLIGVLTEELQSVLLLKGVPLDERTKEVILSFTGDGFACSISNHLHAAYHYLDIEELV